MLTLQLKQKDFAGYAYMIGEYPQVARCIARASRRGIVIDETLLSRLREMIRSGEDRLDIGLSPVQNAQRDCELWGRNFNRADPVYNGSAAMFYRDAMNERRAGYFSANRLP